jgi:hypothetical protein
VTEPSWVCPYCHRDCVAEVERLTELEQLVQELQSLTIDQQVELGQLKRRLGEI